MKLVLAALACAASAAAAELVRQAVGVTGSQQQAIEASRRHACNDALPDCAELARPNLTGCAERPSLLTDCPRTCETCAYRSLVEEATRCEDRQGGCTVRRAA